MQVCILLSAKLLSPMNTVWVTNGRRYKYGHLKQTRNACNVVSTCLTVAPADGIKSFTNACLIWNLRELSLHYLTIQQMTNANFNSF